MLSYFNFMEKLKCIICNLRFLYCKYCIFFGSENFIRWKLFLNYGWLCYMIYIFRRNFFFVLWGRGWRGNCMWFVIIFVFVMFWDIFLLLFGVNNEVFFFGSDGWEGDILFIVEKELFFVCCVVVFDLIMCWELGFIVKFDFLIMEIEILWVFVFVMEFLGEEFGRDFLFVNGEMGIFLLFLFIWNGM